VQAAEAAETAAAWDGAAGQPAEGVQPRPTPGGAVELHGGATKGDSKVHSSSYRG